jgi:hypothetical protein
VSVAADDGVAARQGTLLIADISGYTAFLQKVGAAHGEEMAQTGVIPPAYPLMATLLDGIIERLIPPFTLSKTEGDAVFAFADADDLAIHGQQVLDCIDACYGGFKGQIAAGEAARTCRCSACALGIALDLKFILHAGTYVVHPIAGREELLGPDVNAVHRLLKNHAADVVGNGAYALFTAAAAAQLELPLGRATPVTDRYDHLESIESYVFPLPIGAP